MKNSKLWQGNATHLWAGLFLSRSKELNSHSFSWRPLLTDHIGVNRPEKNNRSMKSSVRCPETISVALTNTYAWKRYIYAIALHAIRTPAWVIILATIRSQTSGLIWIYLRSRNWYFGRFGIDPYLRQAPSKQHFPTGHWIFLTLRNGRLAVHLSSCTLKDFPHLFQ